MQTKYKIQLRNLLFVCHRVLVVTMETRVLTVELAQWDPKEFKELQDLLGRLVPPDSRYRVCKRRGVGWCTLTWIQLFYAIGSDYFFMQRNLRLLLVCGDLSCQVINLLFWVPIMLDKKNLFTGTRFNLSNMEKRDRARFLCDMANFTMS